MLTECFEGRRVRFAGLWPWLVLGALVVPAVWHVVDFPDDRDVEFPSVTRPTFSRRPPPAYRLAEPGDTIDRIAIYASAAGVILALVGLKRGRGADNAVSELGTASIIRPSDPFSRGERGGAQWLAALGMALAALWHSATPGPTFDGWHGLGWRSIFDPSAPTIIRISLASAALGLVSLVAVSLWIARGGRVDEESRCRRPTVGALLVAALILAAARQLELPGVEPVGYWPRWAWVWGIAAFDLALVRAMSPIGARSRLASFGGALGGAAAWSLLVVGGVWLTWYHRPLERLRVVEPGRIFMSAMPTARGLEVAHGRHHFKTIINLFPENPPLRHPLHPDEVRFAREHGVRYVESPGGVASSDAFLDETLRLARDPGSWPILVHCHGCMDRTPAWMGIYRFVVQGRPLAEILQEIERHRGYRPKASVTLLYNRVLSPRAPERYAADPTALLLRACAGGTRDPYEDQLRAEIRRANPSPAPRVSRGDAPRVR